MEEGQRVVNEKGGAQSYIGTCYRCIPPDAIERVAKTLEHGRAKYGKDNWKLIPYEEHIEHALRHLYKALEGGSIDEDDLSHAAARILFALHLEPSTSLEDVRNPGKPISEAFDGATKLRQQFDTICRVNGWGTGWEEHTKQRNDLWVSLLRGDKWGMNLMSGKYVKLDENRNGY